ncbi:UvrD-helicase domain-containing protein [Legionella waltersii]|uniref:DNA 3'-5' helicase n=1 Tax=Legionella waltersii TaxID=66969 RepID=A0A0W1AB83_9GAMM|nr:UvrD-helicase domain-containing protein [Legionella waltersii]KTD78355.1 ATP-dependent DNA helicase [Legionella waltersii]SNV06489.1 ATP-dependent DNA helicase (UvrD/Rep helicase) [Legionella waltersii]
MTLIDSVQRSQATDPNRSFIVQAPAGSGKTEILTQRFLRLLGTVSNPEQIIALTFTRKAASEMRERIILALNQAAENAIAASQHQQTTLDFAKQALKQNKHYQWNLLQQPNRLRIITIDSLCQSINQAIPLYEKQIAYAEISDTSFIHYNQAARNCLDHSLNTKEYQEAIKTLLLHVDNKQDHLISLFESLLSQRDQWLSLLFHAKEQEKSTFETALRLIEQHELARLKNSLPSELAKELIELCRTMADIENNPESPRYRLKDWYGIEQLSQEFAIALSKLILGSDKQLRKSFDHHVGLSKKDCTPEEYQHLKLASTDLLNQLQQYPNFITSLIQVTKLPRPEYDEEQWKVLQSLFVLLPLLTGFLHLSFSDKNEIDFTAVSQQALNALGTEEHPTDLALYLDHAIHHLLIDEFQDTSITQFELLNKLVQGWSPGDGKTLFIVGDPMQSIYRFRQAEVGLFFRAKEQGIGPISLEFLQLSCNFRSTATIINWVNQQFDHIFPKQFDIESGAVSFHASVHVLESNDASYIKALQFANRDQEAKQLIEIVRHELGTHPEKNIAILVRSRTQLPDIIQALRENNIPYQGTEIDLLSHLTHLRDVWSIAQALLFPGNRLTWLASLHGPYCGLALKDIQWIAEYNTKKSIYSNLLNLEQINELSEEGRLRASYFIQVMHTALSQRYQNRLSDWIRSTLANFLYQDILEPKQLLDLEQLWMLIDKYEEDGRIANFSEFTSELEKLYSKQVTPSPLQIMTIHKSKGLEFDTVILPGIGSQAPRGESPLLRWLRLPTKEQGELLLFSPIKGAHQENCSLYDYLQDLDDEKSLYEAQRLLYVAVTRAKSKLYLLDSSNKSYQTAFRHLLKTHEFLKFDESEIDKAQEFAWPKLEKLPIEYYEKGKSLIEVTLNEPSLLTSGIPRIIGIVTHQLMKWICDHHPLSIEQVPWNWLRTEFTQLGFNEVMTENAINSIRTQIIGVFSTDRGLWIIQEHHNEHNEYELLVEQDGKLLTRIIDRTFDENSIRWIIDFKTGKEDQSSLEKHKIQLNQYGKYLREETTLPIRCGLYYMSSGHWLDWEYNY